MPRKQNKRARPDPAPGWLWMLIGASLGLLGAFAIWAVYTPRPALTQPAANAAQTTGAPQPASDAESAQQQASQKPPKDDANRFDFYEVLPKFRVVVPGAKPSGAAETPPATSEPGTYVLQVGSFRALEDADRLQARLALLGIESQIQRVAVKDETWHRVRVGPSSDLKKMDRIRRRLQNARIASVLMRVD
jgi:cell division protein FtsN